MPNLPDPKFYHQLGFQDQKRCLSLLQAGHGSGAIISPKDIKNATKLQEYVEDYKATNTELMIDPQLYTSDPVQGQPDTPDFENTADWARPEVGQPILNESMEKQFALEPSRYIVPSPYIPAISDMWLNLLKDFSEGALEFFRSKGNNTAIYSTIAISVNIIENPETRMHLLNSISGLPVEGFYLVSDIPNQPGNTAQLYGLLDIIFRLKRNGYKIVVGYTEPWAMLAFPLGLDGFASSGLKNRRSFNQSNFRRGDGRRGGTNLPFVHLWSPLILNTIRFPSDAELIKRSDTWRKLYGSSPFSMVFEDRSPSSMYSSGQWTRQDSYNNYSWMMCHIAEQFRGTGYLDRVDRVKDWLSSAKSNSDQLASMGVRISSTHFDDWTRALDRYVSDMRDDIEDEFGS